MRYRYLENKTVKETKRTPSFDLETDILIAGLGSAGSIAAIAAARRGLRVIGIDRSSMIGGLSTAGCVWDYYYGSPGGLGDELNSRCREVERGGYLKTAKGSEYDSFSSAVRTLVLEQETVKAGCRLLYQTLPIGVYLEGNRLVGVRCVSEGRQIEIGFRIVIDCTGDIWVARMAGCSFHAGRSTDGAHIICSNAATILNNGLQRNVWDHISIEDCTDSEKESEIILTSAAGLPGLADWFDEQDRLLFLSGVLGERDAPRIVAEEPLTFADYAAGYRTKEPLFYAFSQVDDPNFDVANSDEINQDWRLIGGLYYYGISIGISLGTMLPKGFEGIVTACKGIGIDYDLLGCVRMRRNMEKCGEAAAAVACMAVEQGCSMRKLDYRKLSASLRESGCLAEDNHIGIGDLKKPLGRSYQQVFLPQTPEDIRAGLEKKEPKLAFWAVRTNQDARLVQQLRSWTESKNSILRENSAVALAMLGDRSGAELLCRIIRRGPEKREESVRDAFCYQPYTAALCLLGRIGTPAEAACLMDAADHAHELAQTMPLGGYFCKKGDWTFLFASLAVASVIKIARRNGSDAFHEWLTGWLDEGRYPETNRKNVYRSSIRNLVERFLQEQ